MPPAAPAAPAAPQIDHDIVHKVYGSLSKLMPKMETKETLTLLKTDLGEWVNILREKLTSICPPRANLLRFCMHLTQTNNKELYTAYVVACKAADVKHFSSTAFNDAQSGIGGFIIEHMEKQKVPLAATMRRMIFTDYKAATIALRTCMRTNSKVHGSAPSTIAYNLKKMPFEKSKYGNFSQYLNSFNEGNDMLRGSALHAPEHMIFLLFTKELR